jgi:hypothetical protein
MRGSVVLFLLLPNDGVGERVGETDGGNGVVLRGTSEGRVVVLREERKTSASAGKRTRRGKKGRLTSLIEVIVLGVGLTDLVSSRLLFPAPKKAPIPRMLALLYELPLDPILLFIEFGPTPLPDRFDAERLMPPLQVA